MEAQPLSLDLFTLFKAVFPANAIFMRSAWDPGHPIEIRLPTSNSTGFHQRHFVSGVSEGRMKDDLESLCAGRFSTRQIFEL
mgnify:CR=1 FL=1